MVTNDMKRLAGLSAILIMFAASYASGQAQSIATSQSPHAASTFLARIATQRKLEAHPCCSGIRSQPDAYPLRGMHVGVACTACT